MKRFALLDCEDAEKWEGHEKIYFQLVGDQSDQSETGQAWDVYKCFQNELPSLNKAHQYEVIYITGSHYSANDTEPWIGALSTWLRMFVRQHCNTRLVAICFGSQILARALGGEVGKNPSGRFVLKVEELKLTEELLNADYFKKAAESDSSDAPSQLGTLRLVESHGDQVIKLPEGARLLASSSTAEVEIWAVGDNVLAIQGHPELTCPVVLEKLLPAVRKSMTEEEALSSEKSLRGAPPDSQLLLNVINEFGKGGFSAAPEARNLSGTQESPASPLSREGSSCRSPSENPRIARGRHSTAHRQVPLRQGEPPPQRSHPIPRLNLPYPGPAASSSASPGDAVFSPGRDLVHPSPPPRHPRISPRVSASASPRARLPPSVPLGSAPTSPMHAVRLGTETPRSSPRPGGRKALVAPIWAGSGSGTAPRDTDGSTLDESHYEPVATLIAKLASSQGEIPRPSSGAHLGGTPGGLIAGRLALLAGSPGGIRKSQSEPMSTAGARGLSDDGEYPGGAASPQPHAVGAPPDQTAPCGGGSQEQPVRRSSGLEEGFQGGQEARQGNEGVQGPLQGVQEPREGNDGPPVGSHPGTPEALAMSRTHSHPLKGSVSSPALPTLAGWTAPIAATDEGDPKRGETPQLDGMAGASSLSTPEGAVPSEGQSAGERGAAVGVEIPQRSSPPVGEPAAGGSTADRAGAGKREAAQEVDGARAKAAGNSQPLKPLAMSEPRWERQKILYRKADELVGHLTSAVRAELAASGADLELLFKLNAGALEKYDKMEKSLGDWSMLAEQIKAKQMAVDPLLAIIDSLDQEMGWLESIVAELDEGSKSLAQEIGLPDPPIQERRTSKMLGYW